MWLLAGVLAVPLIEIALFVTVGGWLGLWVTLGIVLGTGTLGVMLLRGQGGQTIDSLRRATGLRRDPMAAMADAALAGVAAVLLILPGFLTDTLGLVRLLPPVRQMILRALAARVQVRSAEQDLRRSGAEVIDGEYFEIAPDGRAEAVFDRKHPPTPD